MTDVEGLFAVAIAGMPLAAAIYAVPARPEPIATCPKPRTASPRKSPSSPMSAEYAKALPRPASGLAAPITAEPFYNWGGFDQGGEYHGRARTLRQR